MTPLLLQTPSEANSYFQEPVTFTPEKKKGRRLQVCASDRVGWSLGAESRRKGKKPSGADGTGATCAKQLATRRMRWSVMAIEHGNLPEGFYQRTGPRSLQESKLMINPRFRLHIPNNNKKNLQHLQSQIVCVRFCHSGRGRVCRVSDSFLQHAYSWGVSAKTRAL